MDMSSGEWLSNLANEDPAAIINHCHMMMRSQVNGHGVDSIFQSSDIIETNDMETVWETKTPSINSSWSSSGQLISFGSSEFQEYNKPKLKKELKNGSKRIVSNTTKEHVVAERRRREKMNQGFLALSALIPEPKKMDKASILADATEYLKQLEERAKQLEQHTSRRRVESVYLVKRMEAQPFDDKYDHHNSDHLLEIEARFLNDNILLRIHSLKKQGLLLKILEEIRNLHLITLNCQTIPFGLHAIDLTIIAQVGVDFRMTSENLVKHLQNALQHFNSLTD